MRLAVCWYSTTIPETPLLIFRAQTYIEMGANKHMFYKYIDIDRHSMQEDIKKVNNKQSLCSAHNAYFYADFYKDTFNSL